MTTSSEELCEICEQPDGEAHKEFKHPFTPPGKEWAPPRDQSRPGPRERRQAIDQGKQGRPEILVVPAPDLALRAALINNGTITTEMLKEAEYALRIPHADPAQIRSDEAGAGGDGADRPSAGPE